MDRVYHPPTERRAARRRLRGRRFPAPIGRPVQVETKLTPG
jgi:hypothetical protein